MKLLQVIICHNYFRSIRLFDIIVDCWPL